MTETNKCPLCECSDHIEESGFERYEWYCLKCTQHFDNPSSEKPAPTETEKPTYEYGEEVEVLDFFNKWVKRVFIMQLPSKEVCVLFKGDSVGRFECDKSGHRIYAKHRKLSKPKEPEYIPYTMETFEPFRNGWFRFKDSNGHLSIINSYNDCNIWLNSASCGVTWEYFFDKCENENGTPCGTLKGEL